MSYVIEKLSDDHLIDYFDCKHNNNELGKWLINQAKKFQERNQSQVWVMCQPDCTEVLGYFALTSHTLAGNTIERTKRDGISESSTHPAQLLGKFALHVTEQGTKASVDLMHFVFEKYMEIAELTGTRYLVLHAPEPKVRGIYSRFGFTLLNDGCAMVIPTSAIKRSLGY